MEMEEASKLLSDGLEDGQGSGEAERERFITGKMAVGLAKGSVGR